MRTQWIGSFCVASLLFSPILYGQDRIIEDTAEHLEDSAQDVEDTAKEIVKEAESLPERATGWLLTLHLRLHHASIGLHERSVQYASEDLAQDIDSSLEELRLVLEAESLKAVPNYNAIRESLRNAVQTMDRLDQLYRDINYYENWDDAAFVVEWLGFLGATKSLVRSARGAVTRNKVAAEEIRRRGRHGLWAWLFIWLGALAVDKFYIENKIEHLKAIYQRQLLGTARLLDKLIRLDDLLVAKGHASVLEEHPSLDLAALRDRLEFDYSFLKDLDESDFELLDEEPTAEPSEVGGDPELEQP